MAIDLVKFNQELQKIIENRESSASFRSQILTVQEAEAVAEALRNNTTLKKLDLNYTCLWSNVAAVLAEGLRDNTTLTTLDYGHNALYHKGATALAEVFDGNTTLTSLNLSWNNLGPEGATEIAEALHDNTTLTSLNLGSNNLGYGAVVIAKALRHSTTLTELDFSDSGLDPKNATEIAEALHDNTTLTSLNLSHNNLGLDAKRFNQILQEIRENKVAQKDFYNQKLTDQDLKLLAEVLQDNTTLTNLNLGSNNFGSKGIAEIAKILKNNTTLMSLGLEINNLNSQSLVKISEGLEHNTTLTKLYLEENKIGPKGAAALAKVLKNNTTLRILYLGDNKLGAKGASKLAKALQKNITLTDLKLYTNNLGHKGVAALAKGLRGNKTLQELALSNNNIGHKGATVLAEALRENTGLTKLDLSCNNLGLEGIAVLTEALRDNSTLTSLELLNCSLCPQSIAMIAEVFQTNTTLTNLDLSNNNLGLESAVEIAKILRSNTLRHLVLMNNNLGVQGVIKIAEALRGNTTLELLSLYRNGGSFFDCSSRLPRVFTDVLQNNTSLIYLLLEGIDSYRFTDVSVSDILHRNTMLAIGKRSRTSTQASKAQTTTTTVQTALAEANAKKATQTKQTPPKDALPLAVPAIVTTTATSTTSTTASTLTRPATTETPAAATTTTTTESDVKDVSLTDYQTLASSHVTITQMVRCNQQRLGSVEGALIEMQPIIDFLQRIHEEQHFGRDDTPETAALNQTYYHLCVYLTNLFIGASAVASTVVERSVYTTGDKIKELLKSFARAAGPLGTLMGLACKGAKHVIKEAGEAIELGEFVAEIVPENLKESVAEHFFTSQEEKLKRFSEKRKTMLEQDGIVTYTAKRLVEIYRDPIVNAGLSEDGIQTLAGQMVLRIFFNIRHGVIGNHADDMVADVLLYRPNQGEKWLGRFFNKKLDREDKNASRLTDIELLSYTNLCWQTQKGEERLCKLKNVKDKVNALGYRDMPEAFATEIREEKIPSAWQTPQSQLTATAVTVTTSTMGTNALTGRSPSTDGMTSPDTQALLRRMVMKMKRLERENQELRESQQTIQKNQQSQAQLLKNVRGTLFQGDAAAEELGLRRDTQTTPDGTLLVTGQDFTDGNAKAQRVKIQSERNEQRLNVYANELDVQTGEIAELKERVETLGPQGETEGSKKGCALM